MKKLIGIRALYEGGRLCISPICALYLVLNGVELQNIALIKGIQAITFLLLDIPAGIFISRIGNYRATIFALFLAMGGFLGYIFGSTLIHFFVAEFLYALSLLIWPVAFDSYAIAHLQIESQEAKLNQYTHLAFSISSLSIIVAALAGGLLYQFYPIAPYLTGICIFGVALYFLSQMKSSELYEKRSYYAYEMLAILKKDHLFSLMLVFGRAF